MALVTWLSAGGTEAERGLTHRSPTLRSAFFISAGFIPRFTRLPARGLVVRPDSLGDLRAGCVTGWHHRLRPLPSAGHPCPCALLEQQHLPAPWLARPWGSGAQQTGRMKEPLPPPPAQGDPSRPTPRSLPSRLGGLRTHHAFSF